MKNGGNYKKSDVKKQRMIIFVDKLPLNTAFKIRLSLGNADGNSSAEISFKTLSALDKGKPHNFSPCFAAVSKLSRI